MGQADKVYDGVIQEILANGIWDKDQKVRTVWADGTPAYTKSTISAQMKFDGTEVPILTKKRVAAKTAINELPLGFWQQKTNSMETMHDMNVRIWDEWEIKEGKWQGTIGPSYGYQLGKLVRKVKLSEVKSIIESGYLSKNHLVEGDYVWLDQVDYLLWQLKFNPSSRRHVVSLWNIHDLDEMALNPCVWHTQWIVKEKKLHLVVGIRSNDMALGNPFNVFQYYVLQRMIAQVTGYNMGTLTFNINDAHIYERHIEGLTEQLNQEDYPAPTLWVNPEVKSFYDFTINDFQLLDYQHGPSIKFEVAI
jgi:thymidylate synthase